jgi:hypothetical protein
MMRSKTYRRKILELQDNYFKDLDRQREEWNRRIAAEYDLAYSEMAAKLRALLVDTNYELFNASDGQLRPKVYAFMANGLAMFHDRAYEGRPNKELKLMDKPEVKEDE